MKNRLSDLNNHLFAQLERLSDEDLTAEQIETEVARTEAIAEVSEQILRTADLQLKAVKFVAEHGERFRDDLTVITSSRASGPPAIEGGK